MSVVKLDANFAIASIVESMLPRFSDSKLGLLIGIDMSISDYGYDVSGNKKVRPEKNIRPLMYFLFVRPSNYTKVFFWEPKKNAKGLDCTPFYSSLANEWFLEGDHDSCWRDAFDSKMTKIYFESCDKFKDMRPVDLSQFINFTRDPTYMYLDIYEQKDKGEDRFSEKGRVWLIKTHQIDFSDLESIKNPDKHISGLLIKGSEDHSRYNERMKYTMRMD